MQGHAQDKLIHINSHKIWDHPDAVKQGKVIANMPETRLNAEL